jgi:uncharacterized membrane protein YuzA (DUF378 family)
MEKYNFLDWTAFVIMVIGGLNWGLYGLFGIDLVAIIFGDFSALSRIVYVIVGISAFYLGLTSMVVHEKDVEIHGPAHKTTNA